MCLGACLHAVSSTQGQSYTSQADLKLKNGLFKHISGPRLGEKLIMNKNGLIFPMCSLLTLRRPQMSLRFKIMPRRQI